MDKSKDIQKLAEVAIESENFELAYNYYCKLLETDIENSNYWLNKALCAAHLSQMDKMLAKEVIVSLKTYFQIEQPNEEELRKIVDDFTSIIFEKILEGRSFITDEINRKFNALQIPAGTLYAVNQLRKVSIQKEVGSKYKSTLFEYFKVMDFVLRKKTTLIGCEKAYRAVNSTNMVSKNNGDFFFSLDGTESESILLKKLFEFSKNELDALSPNNSVTNPPSTSGCFIATATMGDYDNPLVLDLRYFRDNWLLNRTWGNEFVDWYYRRSPKVASVIEKSIVLKKLTYFFIVKPLHLITNLLTRK
jgi:hypothetical protein